jgi:hypothetical protein
LLDDDLIFTKSPTLASFGVWPGSVWSGIDKYARTGELAGSLKPLPTAGCSLPSMIMRTVYTVGSVRVGFSSMKWVDCVMGVELSLTGSAPLEDR